MAGQVMKNWLQQRAHLTPNRVALVFENQEWTYEELDTEVRSLSRKLSGKGVREGNHIAFLMDNHPETVMLIHALHYLNAVMVPLNKRLSPAELDYQLQDADVDVLVVDRQHQSVAKELQFKNVFSLAEILQSEESSSGLNDSIDLDQLHSIIFTSGTTGYPKGVMLTYGNHWWSATGSALNLGIHDNDRWLCAVPLFHVSGLSIVMRSVIYGITMVLHTGFEAKEFVRSVHENRVTIASVVSVMLSNVLDSDVFKPFPESFRCMLLGGGPAPLPLLKRCEAEGIPVFQTYGLSESASQIVTLAPEDSFRKLGSAGKPLFPSQVKIVPTNEDEQVGEIHVKGPNVTAGYYKKEAVNVDKIRDGWLATGDIGYLDEEGFLYVLDRRKDMFVSGGENVYPAEIEACLSGHEAVAEVGVIGAPDDKWGRVPAAFVVVRNGAEISERSLIDYCADRLAKYKVPKIIQFIAEIPRNASNKILRKDLHPLLKKDDHHEG